MIRRSWLAALCLATTLATAPVQAQPADSFYAGKTLNIIVGYGPGAGYDAYARLMARHIGRFIPGNPNVVVQNMPGAGSIKAINYIYGLAPKDGTVMGLVPTSALLEPLYSKEGIAFDTVKFTWIGNMDETVGTCAIWHKTGITSFTDLFQREAVFGGSGASAINSQHAAALKNLLGVKLKIVQGYPGAVETRLAMENGELDGGCGFALSSLLSQHTAQYRSGELKPIVQLAAEKHPDLAGVAHVYDYAKDEEMRQVFDLVFGSHILGRPIAAPPDIPADRRQTLRTAFNAMMSDASFQADAEKARMPLKASEGEAVGRLFNRYFTFPPSVVAKAAAAIRD
jgi:tripartite-type tricarboxylate transporter receptor subunit TctC